jgi:hypothetical protein
MTSKKQSQFRIVRNDDASIASNRCTCGEMSFHVDH